MTSGDLPALAVIRDRQQAAHDWISDLCTGKRRWRMRVPVDPMDSDIVLSEAIKDAERLLAAVEAVLALCDEADAEGATVHPIWIRRAVAAHVDTKENRDAT